MELVGSRQLSLQHVVPGDHGGDTSQVTQKKAV
jgi:hypothetical protein